MTKINGMAMRKSIETYHTIGRKQAIAANRQRGAYGRLFVTHFGPEYHDPKLSDEEQRMIEEHIARYGVKRFTQFGEAVHG